MKTKHYIAVLFCLASIKGFAQFETTMPSMRGLYQSSYINPAFTPESKLSIGLPGINNMGVRMNLSGIDLHTVANSISSDSNYLDFKLLYQNINGPIGISLPIQNDLFYLRFPIFKGYYLGLNNSIKMESSYYLSRDFVGFMSNIYGYNAGKDQNYEMFRLNINAYNETGISLSKEYKRLSIGFRVKYLKGIANLQTENIHVNITNGSAIPFPITISTGGTIHTAGIPLLTATDSINGKPVTKEDKNFSASNLLNSKNDGWGLDFGLGYQFSTRLSAWASVIDLGSSINWKTTTYNYKIDESKVTFNGFNYTQVTQSSAQTQLTDSLSKQIGKSSVTRDTYKTVIPTRYYGGVDYDLSLRDRVGFMFQGLQYLGTFNTAYTANYMHRFFKTWQVTANYSLKNNKDYDLGFGTSTKVGPVQFYFMADNLMSVIRPATARSIYFKLGIQIVFGRIIKTKKLFI